jgi:hypothetical protein
MSSLTMPMRMRRWPSAPPIDSRRTSAMPGGRRSAQAATKRRCLHLLRVSEVLDLAGKGAVDERMGQRVDIGHVGGFGVRDLVAGIASPGSDSGSSNNIGIHK